MQNIMRSFTHKRIRSFIAPIVCAVLFGMTFLASTVRAEDVGPYPYPPIYATAKFHENQEINGLLRAVVDAPTASSLWRGYSPAIPFKEKDVDVTDKDVDEWRLVRCNSSGQPLDAAGKPIAPGGQPALVVKPDAVEPGVSQVHLILKSALSRFNSGDYFLTLARVSPTETDPHPFIVLNFVPTLDQIKFENTGQSGYFFNVNPVYQQALDSGTKRNVLHIALNLIGCHSPKLASLPVLRSNDCFVTCFAS